MSATQPAQLLLRRILDQAGGAAESGYVLVLDGEGLEELPEQISSATGPYTVHRVSTEIGLRHLLWRAKGAPLIAVMPEALAMRIQRAPDILRRSRNQRVHALSVNDVLWVLLGVRVVGAEQPHLQRLALEHVDKLGLQLSRRTLPTVVDRKLLTELLVDVSVGEHVRTRSPAELLAAWVQQPPAWSENVNRLVSEALPSLHGDEGRLLAWALEGPGERMAALVTHGAVLGVDADELPKPVWGPLWAAAAERPIAMDRRILRRTVTRLAEDALIALGDADGPWLALADAVGRANLTPAQLETSRVLPLAFADRCHRLAVGAAAGKAIPASEIEWLTAHRASRVHRDELAVLESMARLSRYLDQPETPGSDIVAQVRDYQRNGAFADLAALQFRRTLASSASYQAEAAKLLTAYRARRDRENRAFADGLAGGYEAALHRATPLHRLWRNVVEPVWQEQPGARLFLVVLDGCSYPVFLELLYALAQDSAFPVGIRPDAAGHVCGLPALAPLPTVTSHARGAIFLGELPKDPLVAETVFRDQEEARTDKGRFNQNPALGKRTRKLFLKGDLADRGVGLLEALQDAQLEVVAAVFNAVDDQIGSSNTGATVRLRPEDITAFKPAIRAALQAGRRVLLTADHGHTPYFDNTLRVEAGKAPRFLSLAQHQAPPEGFIEIDVAELGGPRERRAFAWRTGVYLGGPQVGFHGGCALEEMVVPLAWIERDGLYADEPAWWYGQGTLPERPTPVLVAPPLLTPAPSDPPASLPSLFPSHEPAARLDLPEAVLAALSEDEKVVLSLIRENGVVRVSVLAERVKRNVGRMGGWMAQLKRKLHAAGVVFFTDEPLPDGEGQYRYTGGR